MTACVVGEIVKDGAARISANVVEELCVPDVPLIVTVNVPLGAELLAVNVSWLAPFVGFGVNDAVTPLGRPDTERLALPVNP